ncbi:MAG: hypothetical protein JOY82_25365 [Streptosporangiaceae bacterium]|nr:hypothetical protein [Streptosporangiaceae bacterium]MBV9857817.1 hypothetical protein [Streptosporangiaceae bacterium]
MSDTVSRDPATAQAGAATDGEAAGARQHRRGGQGRGRWAAAGVSLAVVLAGGVAAWYALVFRPHGSPGGGGNGPAPPATATVARQDLSSQTPVNGTLGYAESYTVTGKGAGTLTWLPSAGQRISQGQVLYRVDNGSPVILMYGTVPAWRTLSEGVTGADVTQLNHDLVALGYSDYFDISSLGWDYFSWDTKYGLQQLQSALGISSPSGKLTLGSLVFEPSALRVATVTGSLGNPASGPVLTATSTRHVVTIGLNASQQTEVKPGDAVTVSLPSGASTPGVISSVGTVASGSGGSATIPVTVTLTNASAAGSLDQAPVTVEITSASVRDALVVPVGALLAQPSGSYAVEVVGAGGTRHLLPVSVGLFDDAAGLVQVSGSGLAVGQHVVVPAT